MPNIRAAEKALRQTKKRTARNISKKKKIRDLMKETRKAIEAKSAEAPKLVQQTHKALDKAAKSNTIHANKASRLKAQIQKKLNTAK